MEEAKMKIQDFYHMVKIHAMMGNEADIFTISTEELQGLLRCYLYCLDGILSDLREETCER